MPDQFPPKNIPRIDAPHHKRQSATPYAELQCLSNFSFLTGASHPEELIRSAHALGLKAVGLCDVHSLAGIVRAHSAARELGMRFHAGARIDFLCREQPGGIFSVLCYPISLTGYQQLSALLSKGKLRSETKSGCQLYLEELFPLHKNLHLIIAPGCFLHKQPLLSGEIQNTLTLEKLRIYTEKLKQVDASHGQLSIALTRNYGYRNKEHIKAIHSLAAQLDIPLLATNDVHYHHAKRKQLQDVLTCIKYRTDVENAGYLLFQNSDRCIKAPEEMWRIFRDTPEALKRSLEISEAASAFSLEQLRYEYPHEVCPDEDSPLAYLKKCTLEGASERYPEGIPEKVSTLLKEEFSLIEDLQYEKYFLTCYDIVKFARSRNILCQGRGAAANSVVCYCLGITAVDPTEVDLLFARFVSKERNEPPDIDIDFEHERREEVIQYIYRRFGRRRAALTAEVVTYRHRSAVREVGKALGFSNEMVDRIAKTVHRWTHCDVDPDELRAIGLEPTDFKVQLLFSLSSELLSFPRHLSQHVGGFIISEAPLDEIVPILPAAMPERTIIEWDKDDIEQLGMLKIDILALGMLTCIRKGLSYVNQRRTASKEPEIAFHQIPPEEPAVYDLICRADTIGIFQVESRAQMSMLPRLRPRCYYDLVIEVAIVRPGPIQGNMVHPFLRRRNGQEVPRYPDKAVEEILGKTLGVPIFQEQAMRLAITLAGFSPGEAEQLRRAMAAWKRNDNVIATFKERIIRGMLSKGYSTEFAESVMHQIRGFSEYGFPESHAASFALLVYASAWLKCFYPAEFYAGLLNSLPMGFYAPSQIIQDAQRHGIEVRAVDINHSAWDCTLEQKGSNQPALRLGMRFVKRLSELQGHLLARLRSKYGDFSSIDALWKAAQNLPVKLQRSSLISLARADAFQSLGLSSRQALWQIDALPVEVTPFEHLTQGFSGSSFSEQQQIILPLSSKREAMFQDYSATSFSLKAHPLSFLRSHLKERGVRSAKTLKESSQSLCKKRTAVAGLAIFRQRPGTAKGVVFISLEDETGIANLIIRPDVFEKYQKIILQSSSLLCHGILESVDEVVYVMAQRLESLDALVLGALNEPTKGIELRSYSY